ncbi:MAG TPA: calcium/sodium antiporter, partial [Gammaproteobacteria bacterium]|nr:calcium/sodium antiporter [Gammaproteobacteria bacterium]
MLTSALAVVAGFALLVWAADRFVIGAAAMARNLGISPLVIGLTIVGFGTSAPEMLISAISAWDGNPGVAVGNALGSNIANLGLVLGATALVKPLQIHSATLQREYPMMFIAMIFALLL